VQQTSTGDTGRGRFTRDRQIAWQGNYSFMSQNAPGRLFTSAVLHSSADDPTYTDSLRCLEITWQSIYADYDWKLIRCSRRSVQGHISFFFSHNLGLCQGFAVVTSAFKSWTCVTWRACVHTAQVINNNPYCATLLVCIELHRAVLKLQEHLSPKQACLCVTITPHTSAVTGARCYCYRATFRETHWVNLTCSSAYLTHGSQAAFSIMIQGSVGETQQGDTQTEKMHKKWRKCKV